MSGPWGRRNLRWLLALPFIIALALLASSQRFINLYLQSELIDAVPAVDGTARLSQDYDHFGTTHHREVTVTLRSATVVATAPGPYGQPVTAPPGGVLWQLEVEFETAPDQVVAFCSGTLVADGVSYSPNAAKFDTTSSAYLGGYDDSMRCAPRDTPGPEHDAAGPGFLPEETPPRPTRYTETFSFVLPERVRPQEFRLWWLKPTYLSFPLPS